jgi:prepilin-type N-terminal cleavage/methylation domain-containing protein
MSTIFNKRGFSLFEMLIYISILSIIFLVVVNTTLSFTSSYRTLSALRSADHAAIDSFELMTRDIRSATTIGSITSGSVYITATENGNSTTTQFYLSNGAVQMNVNGAYYGPLSASNANVTSLTFTQMSTTSASAIKIDMTVQGISGSVTETKNFHSTVVLRG